MSGLDQTGSAFPNGLNIPADKVFIGGTQKTLATTTDTQTLTNKTLTSPVVNTPTITGGTMNGMDVEVSVIAGEAIAAGDLVYPSGYDATSGKIKVKKADADGTTPAKVAWFVAPAAINNGAAGVVRGSFLLTGKDTSAASAVGDPVYLDATTAGGWTLNAPSGAGVNVQQVGVVTVDNATTGAVLLMPFFSKGVTATS